MTHQTTIVKKPLPLRDFMREMGKLTKSGNWKMYRASVAKRIKYFEDQGLVNKF